MTTAYVNFHAPIVPLTTQHLMAACGQLLSQGTSELYLMLSTPGGQVASGLTLYNFLTALPCSITTHNTGNVDSIGNAVFLAGNTRRACPHSTFMFHGVGFDGVNTRLEERNLREMLMSTLADQRRIGAIISSRTNISPNRTRHLFREARTKDANDALKDGIVQKVCGISIPAGSPVLTLVFN